MDIHEFVSRINGKNNLATEKNIEEQVEELCVGQTVLLFPTDGSNRLSSAFLDDFGSKMTVEKILPTFFSWQKKLLVLKNTKGNTIRIYSDGGGIFTIIPIPS